MNGINGVGKNQPVQKVVQQPIAKKAPVEAASGERLADKLELSGVSHLLGRLKSEGIRTDKVAAIKAQIEAGTYEDDSKLDGAIERLLEDLV